MPAVFCNEPLTNFTTPENRKAFTDALALVESRLGATYPLVIGGRDVAPGATFDSINPANPAQRVATFAKAGAAEARAALDAAWTAFPAWADWPAKRRAKLLFDAAAQMRARKHEFSAAMVFEVGKPWAEADGDTAEAIDFLEFYARQALDLQSGPKPCTQIPDELSELFYIPLGAGVVIPPWNFPVAIMVGMTSAAIVAGNTVVLKPSSDSPLVAQMFFDVLSACGLPPGVVNFLPGGGATAGEELVTHPRTRFISFTGSKEVGLGIVEKAGRTVPGQIWIKRVIAEMGGKDTMVIDRGVDLDLAAAAVSAAAFGFSGQKCSACSRAIIHPDVYDAFREKLLARVAAIRVGDPRDPATGMGPVVNRASLDKCLSYVEIGKSEGRLVAGGETPAINGGYFLTPAVFDDVKPGARLDQEEIFGPILALIRGEGGIEGMIRIANATEFGLTGAIWTNDRMSVEYAKRHFHVGNLYINRKCTGALVDVHPFGGFNMSGTDSKAGGRDYLLLFTQAKSISEKFN